MRCSPRSNHEHVYFFFRLIVTPTPFDALSAAVTFVPFMSSHSATVFLPEGLLVAGVDPGASGLRTVTPSVRFTVTFASGLSPSFSTTEDHVTPRVAF